ncbi:MAG TPA: DUF3866 family protein [Solirubrobacterales bacterium]|nr:DUF3866 family protein [Solirubrobacterales bacterium]
MSGRLDLRRGVVVSESPLIVEIAGERRPAWADAVLLGDMRAGDEVVVNAAALDLGLGSGGFDVVHVNLTRGLRSGVEGDAHVMKLNYTSLQHPVEPVEARVEKPLESSGNSTQGYSTGEEQGDVPASSAGEGGERRTIPVAVLPLHGHLAPAAWAAAQARPGIRVGFVQTAGGALPGSLSRDVTDLGERGLLCGHITASPSYGGEHEALSTVGALDAAANALGWDAVLVGPGPGIIGSDTEFGHGGMSALDNAHASLSLRLPTIISPRLSSGDPRERHRGLSHHTATVLHLLLIPVTVAIPADTPEPSSQIEAASAGRHRLVHTLVDLDAYAASGLPTSTMGRQLQDDPLFFEAPLAAGTLLANLGRVAP